MAEKHSRMFLRLAVYIVLAATAAGGAATWYTRNLESTYQARTLLILAPMPIEQEDKILGNLTLVNEPTRRVNFLKVKMLEALPMPDYKAILTSQDITARLRNVFQEQYQQAGVAAGGMTLERVARSIEVRSRIQLQTSDRVEYQRVVELVVTAKDPKVAAGVANAWAEMGIEMAERIRKTASEGAVEFMQKRYDEAWGQYEALQQQLETIEGQYNPEGMKQRLAEMESSFTSNESRKSDLAIDIARLEGETGEMDKLLATPEKTDAGELAARRAGAISELAGLRAQRQAMEEESVRLQTALTSLRADVARVNGDQEKLRLKIDGQKKTVEELNLSLQAVRTVAEDPMREFKIVSRAVPPEEKSGPQRSLMILVAVVIAAIAAPVYFFGMIALRRYAALLDKEA